MRARVRASEELKAQEPTGYRIIQCQMGKGRATLVLMNDAHRPRRDFKGLRRRRRAAAALFAGGRLKQSEIARRLGVSRTSVSRWYEAWRREGSSGLYGAGRAGRKPRMAEEDLKSLDLALRQGAMVWGFPTDLWTLPRASQVIEELTGVKYHPGHVWKVLRSLKWTRQPTRRAQQRNDREILRWIAQEWPGVRKTPEDGMPPSSSRTKAGSATGPRSGRPERPKVGRLPS